MKPTRLVPALVTLAALAACGPKDKRLAELTVGISKDSALKVMGVEKPTRIDPYLTEGKFIELMYFAAPGVVDSVPDRDMTPLVAVNGLLIGWGWETLDSVAGATKIQVAPKPAQ
jgi:hypothetical protein